MVQEKHLQGVNNMAERGPRTALGTGWGDHVNGFERAAFKAALLSPVSAH